MTCTWYVMLCMCTRTYICVCVSRRSCRRDRSSSPILPACLAVLHLRHRPLSSVSNPSFLLLSKTHTFLLPSHLTISSPPPISSDIHLLSDLSHSPVLATCCMKPPVTQSASCIIHRVCICVASGCGHTYHHAGHFKRFSGKRLSQLRDGEFHPLFIIFIPPQC